MYVPGDAQKHFTAMDWQFNAPSLLGGKYGMPPVSRSGQNTVEWGKNKSTISLKTLLPRIRTYRCIDSTDHVRFCPTHCKADS